MNPIWVVLAVLIVLYGVYYLISYLLLPRPIDRIGPEQVKLSTVVQVISSEDLKNAWTTTSGSTLAFYIFPEINDRTSVSGNEYATAVQIGTKQNFKLLVAPDAGRGYSVAPAVLEVFVQGYDTPDILEIPNVPLQRWTSVVIVKQGRKFNIYINGKLTVSHMCTAMPEFDDTQPLRVGSSRMGGTLALMSLASYPMKSDDVRTLVNGTIGEDGNPYLSSGIFDIIPIPKFEIKNIFGSPDSNGIIGKPGPMEQWSSPYA